MLFDVSVTENRFKYSSQFRQLGIIPENDSFVKGGEGINGLFWLKLEKFYILKLYNFEALLLTLVFFMLYLLVK